MADHVKLWRTTATVFKFEEGAIPFVDDPYEVLVREGNLALTEGLTELVSLLIGAGGTAYNNGAARIGVGDSTTAEAIGQTDLQAAVNKTYVGMDATYPQQTAAKATFRSSFAAANFAWQEWTVDNGTKNLNRKVESFGTKSSGTWVFQVDLTFA